MLLEGESYAIPIESLVEITASSHIQKDPKLSEVFEGKFEYRGKIIPVVNLKKVLKLAGQPGGSLLVIKNSRGMMGLLADAAKELLETKQKPDVLPRGVMNSAQSCYAGVLHNREDLVLLLNEDALLP